MAPQVALLGISGSKLLPRLQKQLAELGLGVILGDLDAAQVGESVTIRTDDQVLWEGTDLRTAALIYCEFPVFSWPQVQRFFQQPGPNTGIDRVLASERQAQALTISALRILAESRPVLPALEHSYLAVCPLAALDNCAAAGLPTAPWHMGCLPENAPAALDIVGSDRWQRPAVPQAGHLGIHFPTEQIPAGSVTEILVLGEKLIAARTSEDVTAWLQGKTRPAAIDHSGPAGDLARRAVGILGVTFGAVSLVDSEDPCLLWINVHPDFLVWENLSEGQVLRALARLLAERAADTPTA